MALLAFSLDWRGPALSLTFSEAVTPAQFTSVAALMLQSRVAPATPLYAVTLSSSIATQTGATPDVLVVQLSAYDASVIVDYSALARSVPSTFLSLNAAKLSHSPLQFTGIAPSNAIRASAVTLDHAPANVTDATLTNDAVSGLPTLMLTFSKPMSVSVVPAGVLSLTANDSAIDPVPLHPVSVRTSAVDRYVVSVVLSSGDIRALRQAGDIATSTNDTFLHVNSASSFVDVFGATAAIGTEPLSVVDVDLSSPELVGYVLNATANVLLLNFSEPVVLSSLVPAGVLFHTRHRHTPVLTLAAYAASSFSLADGGTVVLVELLTATIANLIAAHATEVSLLESTVANSHGNTNDGSLDVLGELVVPHTAPQLQGFSLIMTSSSAGTVILTFSAPIQPKSFALADFRISTAYGCTSCSHVTLAGSTVKSVSPSWRQITLALPSATCGVIVGHKYTGTSALTLSSTNAARDIYGNAINTAVFVLAVSVTQPAPNNNGALSSIGNSETISLS